MSFLMEGPLSEKVHFLHLSGRGGDPEYATRMSGTMASWFPGGPVGIPRHGRSRVNRFRVAHGGRWHDLIMGSSKDLHNGQDDSLGFRRLDLRSHRQDAARGKEVHGLRAGPPERP